MGRPRLGRDVVSWCGSMLSHRQHAQVLTFFFRLEGNVPEQTFELVQAIDQQVDADQWLELTHPHQGHLEDELGVRRAAHFLCPFDHD